METNNTALDLDVQEEGVAHSVQDGNHTAGGVTTVTY